jgi:hypothetical protein
VCHRCLPHRKAITCTITSTTLPAPQRQRRRQSHPPPPRTHAHKYTHRQRQTETEAEAEAKAEAEAEARGKGRETEEEAERQRHTHGMAQKEVSRRVVFKYGSHAGLAYSGIHHASIYHTWNEPGAKAKSISCTVVIHLYTLSDTGAHMSYSYIHRSVHICSSTP